MKQHTHVIILTIGWNDMSLRAAGAGPGVQLQESLKKTAHWNRISLTNPEGDLKGDRK